MARSYFTKDNGLQHLSDKERSAVRSFAYRIRCLLEAREYNHKLLSLKEKKRILLYHRALMLCATTKTSWSECVKVCENDLKQIEGDKLPFGIGQEVKLCVKMNIKDCKNGKGIVRFKKFFNGAR